MNLTMWHSLSRDAKKVDSPVLSIKTEEKQLFLCPTFPSAMLLIIQDIAVGATELTVSKGINLEQSTMQQLTF